MQQDGVTLTTLTSWSLLTACPIIEVDRSGLQSVHTNCRAKRSLEVTEPCYPCFRLQRSKDKLQSPAVQERQRAFQSLESSLSSQLDPIDWATYEPYLWANEATYYQRSATLFGALMQTRRMHNQVAQSALVHVISLSHCYVSHGYDHTAEYLQTCILIHDIFLRRSLQTTGYRIPHVAASLGAVSSFDSTFVACCA